jgi:hypothetical protein
LFHLVDVGDMTDFLPFRWHGDLLHEVGIFLAIRVCHLRGYRILDSEAFAKKEICPAIPDVFASTEYHYTDNYGRKTQGRKNLIIEIETDASKQSVLKKWRQYVESSTGLELIVLDLNEVTDPFNLSRLWKYVNERIP